MLRIKPGRKWTNRLDPVSSRFGADQHWPTAFRPRVFRQHAQPARDFLVCLEHAPQVAPEAVLVELVGRRYVPEPAAIWADLVSQQDVHLLVVPLAAELHFEIYESDADAQEQPNQEIVDAQGHSHDLVDLLGGGPAECRYMLFRDHRVIERIVLVI